MTTTASRRPKSSFKPYIADGLISHIPFADVNWPDLRSDWFDYHRPSIQELAYGHCITRFGNTYRFLLKIDVDEFVFPAQPRHATLVEAMRELDRDKTMGIEIPMLDFGSSHHLRKPPGLTIEAYTKTRPGLSRLRRTIGNARFLARDPLSNPHRFRYRLALAARMRGAAKLRPEAAAPLFRLNHYFTKSLEEYLRKGKINSRGAIWRGRRASSSSWPSIAMPTSRTITTSDDSCRTCACGCANATPVAKQPGLTKASATPWPFVGRTARFCIARSLV